jgi:sugar diacid utilization regulator
MSDLQGLVDALATDLGRPVGLDDRRLRSLAYSPHVDELDRVRLSSILQRVPPRDVTEYLGSLGIDQATAPVRVPSNPGLGMVARVCVPVTFGQNLLGYAWFLDEPEELSDDELRLAEQFAGAAAAVLYRERHLEHTDRARERELLAQLLGHRYGDAQRAAELLGSSGLAAASSDVRVLVARAWSTAAAAMDDAARVRLAAASDRLRRSSAPHHVLTLSVGDDVVILLLVGGAGELARKLDLLRDYMIESFADEPHWTPIVGVSDRQFALAQAPSAYRQALAAAELANSDPQRGPIVRWSDMGAYRTILQLLGGQDPEPFLPQSLVSLLDASDAEMLIGTLGEWLEHGGDTRRTAEALHIHRSSLYNRLHRVERTAGVDLGSGEDRLELHLGIRLWKLAGNEELPRRNAA